MKKIKQQNLTLKLLKEYLQYNPNGYFTWLKTPDNSNIKVNSNTEFYDRYSGYMKIQFFGIQHRVHRLVFFYHNGRFPVMIDHINRIKTDNRILNLVETTKAKNARNTGVQERGCYDRNGKFAATFNNGNDRYNLGVFATKKEALEAYDMAAVMILNEKIHLNFPHKYKQYLIKSQTHKLPKPVHRNRTTREISVKDVREYFSYYDGILYWAKKYSNRIPGDIAGTPNKNNQELVVSLYDKKYNVRRIIWMHQVGEIKGQIKYINGRSNHLSNLYDTGI